MAKRIIGLFLALCLVVGLLPMIALAEEGAEPPTVTATLTVSAGTADALAQWTPELTQGMAPAYAKTSAEGNLITEGVTEADWNLKVEWAANSKPTLTLKNATINNSNIYPNKKDTIVIGGTEDFVIALNGTNLINCNPTATNFNVSAYKIPFGIKATNTGDVIIRGTDKATDSLYIDNKGGHSIDKSYGGVTVENATFDLRLHGISNGYPQIGILLKYGSADYADKTNLTVRNANFTIKIGNFDGGSSNPYASYAVVLAKDKDDYNSTNTGDILFQNSTVYLYRKNSSGRPEPIVRAGANSTVTFDRCDMATSYAWRVVFAYIPTVLNCNNVVYTQESDSKTVDYDPNLAGTAVNIRSLKMTHTCISSAVDDFDCTTAAACDVCGKAMTEAKTAHTPAADDGNCTTAITCSNEGCKVVTTPAKAAHTPAADDGDCTTAIKCTVCGTETTAAKAAHTGGTATCTKKAVCTVCNKEYGELAAHTPAARPSCDVAANCTVCGQVALKAGEHKGGTATCQAKAKCTECGKEYGELAAHKGGTATCKDKAKCTVCGKEYGELLTTHTGGTATCTAKAKCTVCGKEYGELAAHKPAADDGDCTTAIKCTVCQAETTAAKEHKFTNDKDASCDNAGCKHTRTLTTNPSTGDISILLTAAVALTSAVGFAGVTVLRKKEN